MPALCMSFLVKFNLLDTDIASVVRVCYFWSQDGFISAICHICEEYQLDSNGRPFKNIKLQGGRGASVVKDTFFSSKDLGSVPITHMIARNCLELQF